MKRKYSLLKVMLDENDITYKELAKQLNIAPATLGNKINGKYDFTLDEVRQVIDMLGITECKAKCDLIQI